MYKDAGELTPNVVGSDMEAQGEELTQAILDRLAQEVLDTELVGGLESLLAQMKHPENTLEDIEMILAPVIEEIYVQGAHDYEFIDLGNPENDPQLEELKGLEPIRLLDEYEKATATGAVEQESLSQDEATSEENVAAKDELSEARRARWQIILSQPDIGGINGLFKSVSGEQSSAGVLRNAFCRVYALGYLDRQLIVRGNPNNNPHLAIIAKNNSSASPNFAPQESSF